MTKRAIHKKLAWLAVGSLLALAAFGSSVGAVSAHDSNPCATQLPTSLLTPIASCDPCDQVQVSNDGGHDGDACDPCASIAPATISPASQQSHEPEETEHPKPTCAPTAAPTLAPSPTPVPSFTGGAGGVTDQPTLPPTDRSGGIANVSDSLGLVLMLMAAALAGLMVLTPARRRR